jgi:hypothetical protein
MATTSATTVTCCNANENTDKFYKGILFESAIKQNHMNCLVRLLSFPSNKKNNSSHYTELAADYTNLKAIELLAGAKYVFSEDTASMAAYRGSLDILTYLHECKCPINSSAIKRASEKGHLECVQYLCSVGYKPDLSAAFEAAANNHLHVLKWLYKNKHLIDLTVLEIAEECKSTECVEFLKTLNL